MLLRTLGKLELEGSSFSQPSPLLLLSYLALADKPQPRSFLAELFWPHAASSADSLAEALRRLRRVSPTLVREDEQGLGSEVVTDVSLFEAALVAGDLPRALALYRAAFLEGLEFNRRLSLGEELREWLVNRREALQAACLAALLRRAEALAQEGDFSAVAELAERAVTLDTVSYFNPGDYRRLHRLLLAVGKTQQAAALEREAAEIYEGLEFLRSPKEARAQLTLAWAQPPHHPDFVFVGRQRERAALRRLLTSGQRLVTLTGLAGVGKTALAVQMAHELKAYFADGVRFVRLEALPPETSGQDLTAHLLRSLGLPIGDARLDDLAAQLGDGRLLLLLDNFEQLTAHNGLLIRLLDACPHLVLLVTSREALRLRAERVFRLHGLPFPASGDAPPSLSALPREGNGAVQLFVAQAERRGALLEEADLPEVIAICRLVQGLPLALKLAADWTPSAALATIAAELESSLDLLTAESPEVAERHYSLRAAFDFSWRLLSAPERAACRRLSAFAGGFTLEAAAQVTGAGLPTLKALVDKSLLDYQRELDRYSFHPLLRHFAAERLAEDPREQRRLLEKHAHYFLDKLMLMTEGLQELKNQAPRLLDAEADNLRAAWRCAVQGLWHKRLLDAAHPLERFCDVSARYAEGAALLEMAENALDETNLKHAAARANLRASRAWLMVRLGQYQSAIELAKGALALSQSSGCKQGVRTSLNTLGASYHSSGMFNEAKACFEAILAMEPPQTGNAANALGNLGNNARYLGNYAMAQEYFENARETFVSQDKQEKVIWVDNNFGLLLFDKGRFPEARTVFQKALVKVEKLGLHHWTAVLIVRLALAALEEGNILEAYELSLRGLKKARERNKRLLEAEALTLLGETFLRQQRYPQAQERLRQSLATRGCHDVPLRLRSLLVVLELWLLTCEREKSSSLFGFLNAEGNFSRMSFADKERLQRLAKECESSLETGVEKAEAWQALSLEEVIGRVVSDELL